MKIYLLNPPYFREFSRSMRWQATTRGGTLYYPIWLAYATALLEQHHAIRLVDAPAWKWTIGDVVSDVLKYQPELLVVETSYNSWRNDLGVIEFIKRTCSDVTTAIVGPPTSEYHGLFLQSPAVDLVIRGEYDFALRDAVEFLEDEGDLMSIKGVSFKNGNKIVHNPPRDLSKSSDLDSTPFVSTVYKKHLRVKDYFLSPALYPEVQIIAGRGCPYKCTFCEWSQVFTMRRHRIRRVHNVIEEMLWIKRELPEVKEIVFEDDTFTINKEWVIEFCDELIRRDQNFTWSAQVRADLNYELLLRMKKAGCRLVIVGFESGSNDILKNMKKGITVKQSWKFARDVRKAGIILWGDFIVGMPGETKETIKMTWQLINKIRPELLQVSIATPYPGTEFYNWVKQSGYLLSSDPSSYLDVEGHQKAVITYPNLSADEITEAVDAILKRYYLSPKYIPLALRQVFRRNGIDELKRLWCTARNFLKYVYKIK